MLKEIQFSLKGKDYKALKNCFKSIIPSRIESNLVFRKHFGRWINYKNPVYFDEKLLILKSGEYYNNKLVTLCTDKYRVHDYLKAHGYGKILVKLIGSYDKGEQIKFDELPEKFAIKCNHGCAMNIIVKDKTQIDEDKIVNQLNEWMSIDYGLISGEHHYSNINRKIIIEEYIGDIDGTLPVDYKFYMSKGKMICCLVYVGRGTNPKWVFVDKNFKDLHLIDNVDKYYGEGYEKYMPNSWNEMLKISEDLSKDFPFVRVDLYDYRGAALFGELTFTPNGCYHEYMSRETERWIGERIEL